MEMNKENEQVCLKPLLQDVIEQLDVVAKQVCNHYCRFEYQTASRARNLPPDEQDALDYALWEDHCQICPVMSLMRD